MVYAKDRHRPRCIGRASETQNSRVPASWPQSNQQFIVNAIPHIGRLMLRSLDELLAWADHTVVTQRPSCVVIGGLVTSTMLTLVVLPALYRLFEGARGDLDSGHGEMETSGAAAQ
jgi:hypothetical protein